VNSSITWHEESDHTNYVTCIKNCLSCPE